MPLDIGKKTTLVVSLFSKRETPFARYYTDELSRANQECDVVYFERYGVNEYENPNELVFSEYCPTGGNNFKKLPIMGRYARFIRKTLKQGRYRKAVVLTTLPALMMRGLLTKRYRGRYILDIRDYTHEDNAAYLKALNALVEGSYATVLSSRGFLSFLPPSDKYCITHNVPKHRVPMERRRYFAQGHVNVGYVGSVRYRDVQVRLCDAFGNAPACQMSYYGTVTNDCDLEGYCADKGYDNIAFGGRYDNADKPAIYENIDIINGVYDPTMIEIRHAIPNRFYDAALYRCPIMVSKGTYLEELVREYNLGFAVDARTDDLVGELATYIRTFDRAVFEEGCGRLLADVDRDMAVFTETIRAFAEL